MKVILLKEIENLITNFIKANHDAAWAHFCNKKASDINKIWESFDDLLNDLKESAQEVPVESDEELVVADDAIGRFEDALSAGKDKGNAYEFLRDISLELFIIRNKKFVLKKPTDDNWVDNNWVRVSITHTDSSFGNFDGDSWTETAYICPKCFYDYKRIGEHLDGKFDGSEEGLVSTLNNFCPKCGQSMRRKAYKGKI
nr:hypothetical protein [uncultured Butyrivibrio sp.]